MSKAQVLVLAGYGLNCEEETLFAMEHVGFNGIIRHINDVIAAPQILNDVQVLIVPGGFSYGDDTGSGNAFAQKMKLGLSDHLQKFIARDTLTLGICNGCQILANLGLVPGFKDRPQERLVAATYNDPARYQCRWVHVKVNINASPWLKDVNQLYIPVAHGEGRFMMDRDIFEAMGENGQLVMQYCDPVSGEAAHGAFPLNPNGSCCDLAGITDQTGRILAMMPHPERGMFTWQRYDYPELKEQARRKGYALPEESDGMALFRNAARYFEIAETKQALAS